MHSSLRWMIKPRVPFLAIIDITSLSRFTLPSTPRNSKETRFPNWSGISLMSLSNRYKYRKLNNIPSSPGNVVILFAEKSKTLKLFNVPIDLGIVAMLFPLTYNLLKNEYLNNLSDIVIIICPLRSNPVHNWVLFSLIRIRWSSSSSSTASASKAPVFFAITALDSVGVLTPAPLPLAADSACNAAWALASSCCFITLVNRFLVTSINVVPAFSNGCCPCPGCCCCPWFFLEELAACLA